jgi:hypothetical protein
MRKSTKNTTSKIKTKTDNDLGRFLSGNDEVTPKVKSEVKKKVKVEVKSEVKPKLEPQVISEVTFTKEKLIELGFELEVLPSGQKTNLSHKQKFILNEFTPMFFRGFYTYTVHYAPDKIYAHIKSIEFV